MVLENKELFKKQNGGIKTVNDLHFIANAFIIVKYIVSIIRRGDFVTPIRLFRYVKKTLVIV